MASERLSITRATGRTWLLALVVLLCPCALSAHESQESDRGSVRTVEVELDEFSIAMPGTLAAGPARLVVVNVGQAEHNVEFSGAGIDEKLGANLMSGESDTLLIDFAPGRYYVFCPVGRHESYGMHVDLTVLDGGGRAPVGGTAQGGRGKGPVCTEKLIRWLGAFHPAAVNFPIALLAVAALAELLLIRSGNRSFGFAARFCLWIGAPGALAAAVLGWFLAIGTKEKTWLLTTHRWLGTATAVVALMVLVLGERAYRGEDGKGRKVYVAMLFLAAAMVMANGFFGGAMVFGLKHYAWP